MSLDQQLYDSDDDGKSVITIGSQNKIDADEDLFTKSTKTTGKVTKRRRKGPQSYRTRRLIQKEAIRLLRQNGDYREAEQARNTIQHQDRRSKSHIRKAEQERNTTEHQNRRSNLQYREAEKERDLIQHQVKRTNTKYREAEKERDLIQHQVKRTNTEYRQAEKERDLIQHQVKRTNTEYRQAEKERDAVHHQDRRSDPHVRKAEQDTNTQKRQETRNSTKFLIKSYEKGIVEAPNIICVCCGGLFFRRSVIQFETNKEVSLPNKQKFKYSSIFAVDIRYDQKLWICITCDRYATEARTPRLYLKKGLEFPQINQLIEELNETEERLCAPRIAFLRIKPLKWDKQKGLTGNVVNVPVDVESTLQQMPREFNNSETIQLRFMRRLSYNTPYLQDTVRSKVVKDAIQYLLTKPMYQKLNIQVRKEYLQSKGTDTPVAFLTDTSDTSQHNSSITITRMSDVSIPDDENELEDENQETMLVQNDYSIAPGEANYPIALVSDKYAEEATFIKIFGGEIVQDKLPNDLSCAAKCKSYFRRYDRRCAETVTYIFYMYKKLMAEKLISAINICLQKFKLDKQITAYDIVHNTERLKRLEGTEELKSIMRTIRSSPVYWEKKKKDLFAMIRQLGSPSFFITLSPAEIEWDELVLILARLLIDDNYSMNMVKNSLTREDKCELIRRDPVTTARYFENRMRHLLRYILNPKGGPFSKNPIQDYYWRVEFQARGSPHLHMLVWCKDTPEYLPISATNTDNRNCIKFIDEYITSVTPDTDTDIDAETIHKCLKYQRHRHRDNCLIELEEQSDDESSSDSSSSDNEDIDDANDQQKNKKKDALKKVCKFGFPWPILHQTIILAPLKAQTDAEKQEKSEAMKTYLLIKYALDEMAKQQEVSIRNKSSEKTKVIEMAEFLQILQLNYIEYIKALRASIKSTTVFLKRTSAEIMLNPYNKDIFKLHRANMDIQYVVDSYGVVAYVTSYVLKSNAVMSRLLTLACQEMEQGNMSIQQKLYALANKFQNCSEISAQECVYQLLSMPVSYCSRENTFIMTFHEHERYSMIKHREILETMLPDATDIYQAGLIDYYINRPNSMSDVCLAEFASEYNFISPAKYNQIKNKKKKAPRNVREEDENDDDEFDELVEREYDRDPQTSDSDSDHNDAQPVIDERFLELKNQLGYVQKRKVRKIISYRRYNKRTQPAEYYREQLMLFLPWTNEQTQLENVDHFEVFETNQNTIAINRAKFEKLMRDEEDADALFRIANEIREQHESDKTEEARHRLYVDKKLLQSLFDYDSETDESEYFENIHGYYSLLQNPEVHVSLDTTAELLQRYKLLNDEMYMRLMSSLNRNQHRLVLNVLNKVKSKKLFYYFVSGGSGTGKSHLIKAIYQAVNRYLIKDDSLVDEPNQDQPQTNNEEHRVRIILAAFTGKAAFLIRGSTLHTAFGLPTSKILNALSDDSLKRFRKLYKNLRLVIIDEISLVDIILFSQVDKRLRQIFQKPTVPFGGLSMIVVGDFNQLRPVSGSWIFTRDSSNPYSRLQPYSTNELWDKFSYLPLTEIMRQRDDLKFAQALTTLGNEGLVGLSKQDISLFDSRIVSNKSHIPQHAIHTFKTNKDVNEFNAYKLKVMPGELFVNRAVDEVIGNENDKHEAKKFRQYLAGLDREKTGQLPYELPLKVNAKYMILVNQDVPDGLVNGACGILKKIVFNSDRTQAIRLYMDFVEPDIGAEARKKHFKDISNALEVNQNWTPIEPQTARIKVAKNKSWSFERSQYAMTVAEAITICKVQGATCPAIGLDLSQHLQTAELYVALSRVTCLDNLYLYGKKTIVEGCKFLNYTKQGRKQLIEEHYKTNRVQVELARLRKEAPFVDLYPFLDPSKVEDYKSGRFSIVYHNITGSLLTKMPFIKADFGLKEVADVILLSQCHTAPTQIAQLGLDGFTLVNLTGSSKTNASNGMALYIKDKHLNKVKMIGDNSANSLYSNEKCVEITAIKMKSNSSNVCICFVSNYVTSCQEFLDRLKSYIKNNIVTHFKNSTDPLQLFVLGSFNLDAKQRSEEAKEVLKYFDRTFDFKQVITNDTTDDGCIMDWCLTNTASNKPVDYEVSLYETCHSPHKPIWLNILLKKST